MFFIRSENEGFRRCGVAHTKAGKEFADDFFTEKQLDLLEADPMILVTYVKEPEPESEPEPMPETKAPAPKTKTPKTKGK